MFHRYIAPTNLVWFAFAGTILACAPIERADADTPPYEARVLAAGAPVHSGPGDNFYPTDTLNEGDTVEVYREKPGGWLAIRPPEGSFSLIAEHDLVLKDGEVAEIAKDDVASRIGSKLSDHHNAAQVRLKKGETVEVLGEETVRGEKWYRVSPPAGEFRWIQASVVERTGAIKMASSPTGASTSADSNPIVQTSATANATTPNTAPANDLGAPPLLPVSKPTDTAANSAPAAAPAATTPPAQAAPAAQAASPAAPPATKDQPQAASSSPSAGDIPHEVAAIDLRLSRMVAAPTNLWNTDKLARDASQLMTKAKTQAERDSVGAIQQKISRFTEIGRRANPNAANVAQAGSPQSTIQANAAAPPTANGQYDAVGILRPVVSRRPGAPQYALVDERGQVVSFVTATPDLNLQPYLGHRIGVTGNRGYIPEFQRSNVTAARVTPLNDRLVR